MLTTILSTPLQAVLSSAAPNQDPVDGTATTPTDTNDGAAMAAPTQDPVVDMKYVMGRPYITDAYEFVMNSNCRAEKGLAVIIIMTS